MAKIVQLKMAGVDIYPRTTTDAIAFVPVENNDNKEEKEDSED
jgi:hypothetical protein